MSEDTRPDAADDTQINAEADEIGAANTDTADAVENAPEAQSGGNADESAGNTFPRTYVEELRKESAKHRDRARQAEERADALARRLHGELVRATDRLENPADLAYDAEHLDDPEKLKAALDALLSDRPYFRRRKVAGDAGQGPRGSGQAPFSLLGAIKGTVNT
ncbi:hypothetical protein A5656_03570 [Mycobacterium gordonae]|jgi:hypothetical protein|uniref:hypothetical protein n=1 Tax=Mycobacterium paragordonae TaxID=1389713 RepID=UPI0007F02A3C|nr:MULTISPECIES: hypothetical protein [Mycobacterium]OBK46502.1 hypothetical protein A5656_03570 [Mycobacterium gordonae]